MLKVLIITQQNDSNYWQETFSNVWEGPVEISLQKEYKQEKVDLVIFDFSNSTSNALDLLSSLASNLVGKHFLIVSDKKDADLAIEAIRIGAIGFLVKPFRRFDLIASLDRLHTSPGGQIPSRRKGHIISLLSYKGGTGVSTATVNLGYALASAFGKKTLIIDAAGFSNHVTILFNVIPKCTLADICKQGAKLDEQYLTAAVTNIGKDLSIIGGLMKTTDFNEINIPSLEKMLELATDIYDFVLVDTSTHLLDEMTMFFIQKSQDLLLLTTFDLLAIRDNRFYIQTLKELGVSEHKIKPIINRQDWYIGSLEPELIQKQLNLNIYYSLPNDWELCVEAANYGRPITAVSPNSPLANAYKILASKFAKSDLPGGEAKEADLVGDKKGKMKGILSLFKK
jgi:pilus assembly protein CpaE